MSTNMIVNILVSIVAIAALCLSVLSLCRSSKDRFDTQYVAADRANASNPMLYTESFSNSIKNWLNDKKVTFDTRGVNFGTAVNITGALSAQGDIKGQGNIQGTSVTSTGALKGNTLGIGTQSQSSIDSNGTASFSDVTTSKLTATNNVNVKGTVSSVGLITAPGIIINGKTFKFSGGLDDHNGCYLTSEDTSHPCS